MMERCCSSLLSDVHAIALSWQSRTRPSTCASDQREPQCMLLRGCTKRLILYLPRFRGRHQRKASGFLLATLAGAFSCFLALRDPALLVVWCSRFSLLVFPYSLDERRTVEDWCAIVMSPSRLPKKHQLDRIQYSHFTTSDSSSRFRFRYLGAQICSNVLNNDLRGYCTLLNQCDLHASLIGRSSSKFN